MSGSPDTGWRSEEHTSELQSHSDLVCRLLLDSSTTQISTLSLHDALPISTATATANAPWTMQAAAFKPSSTDTVPPTAPANLTAAAASGTQINLSWTPSTDNVGVTGYRLEIGRAHV